MENIKLNWMIDKLYTRLNDSRDDSQHYHVEINFFLLVVDCKYCEIKKKKNPVSLK